MLLAREVRPTHLLFCCIEYSFAFALIFNEYIHELLLDLR